MCCGGCPGRAAGDVPVMQLHGEPRSAPFPLSQCSRRDKEKLGQRLAPGCTRPPRRSLERELILPCCVRFVEALRDEAARQDEFYRGLPTAASPVTFPRSQGGLETRR